jgi:hypothetical protein
MPDFEEGFALLASNQTAPLVRPQQCRFGEEGGTNYKGDRRGMPNISPDSQKKKIHEDTVNSSEKHAPFCVNLTERGSARDSRQCPHATSKYITRSNQQHQLMLRDREGGSVSSAQREEQAAARLQLTPSRPAGANPDSN